MQNTLFHAEDLSSFIISNIIMRLVVCLDCGELLSAPDPLSRFTEGWCSSVFCCSSRSCTEQTRGNMWLQLTACYAWLRLSLLRVAVNRVGCKQQSLREWRLHRDPDMTYCASRSQASRHLRSQFISALFNLSDPYSSPRFNAASSTPSHEKMPHWIDMNNWNESTWWAPIPGWFMTYMQIQRTATWLVITFIYFFKLICLAEHGLIYRFAAEVRIEAA